jgi:glycine betaine catabolism B
MNSRLTIQRYNPIRLVDRLIDGINMYVLLENFLIVVLLMAAGLSAFGVLGYSPLAILLSAAYLAVICRVTNIIFAYVFKAPTNKESPLLTALILALLITPLASLHNALFLTAAGGLAMASKYILARHKRHLFNPAAIALLLLYFGAGDTASWWVGNYWLMPVVLAGGLLVARKLRRLSMVLIFFAAALFSTLLLSLINHGSVAIDARVLIGHSSLFFLGFVMLTEPLTTPPTEAGRYSYAALVGLLFPPQLHIFSLYSTPELALIVGNIWSYLISPKIKLLPKLQQQVRLAPDIAEFVFAPERSFRYQAGQYVDVTLAHPHTDNRGNRRMFTLASSPTEATLRFAVKFYPKGSSFKRALLAADAATLRLSISPPAGDFVLPDDPKQKLAFIAGGIGVTPYCSMIKYLLDRSETRDITLLYSERTQDELVYTEIFKQARTRLDAKVVYVLQKPPAGWRGRTGYVTSAIIKAEIPDYSERLFYLSGPLAMITSVKAALGELGIPARLRSGIMHLLRYLG